MGPALRPLPVALLLLAALPPGVHAATVSVEGSTLRYVSGSAPNSVHVALPSAETFRVTDSQTNISAGPGCTASGQRRATCSTAGVTSISIDVGGGADRVSLAREISTPALVRGEGGDDVLQGASGADHLEGGPGDDLLAGATGADAENGGEGNDSFSQDRAANGADAISGGSGVDRAGYGRRSAGLGITLDGAPGDGDAGAGEGDNVGADVEQVTAGSGPDTIVGSDAKNRLEGGPGNDFLDGRGDADALVGGSGADIFATRDLSRDALDCGADPDRVRADGGDRVRRDCDLVRTGAPIRLRVISRRLSGGDVRLRISCGAAAYGPCTGRVVVRTARRLETRFGPRRVRVGSAPFRVDPGTSAEVRVPSRRAAQRTPPAEGSTGAGGGSRRRPRRSSRPP